MCTLTLAWQVFDDAPVAVAANRDEALERESVSPGVYREEPLIVAPRDAEAGGTWIGYNEHGVFAGITNKWTDADLAAERSRGLLVADVLAAESAAAAAETIEAATETDEYDAFNLVVADESAAYCYQWNGTLSRIDFEPGVQVIVNAAVNDTVQLPSDHLVVAREQADNALAVRETLAVEDGESVSTWLERAGDVLGDHEYGVCLHRNGFGTKSSSLIALGPETTQYAFAPGPPCETAYEPVALESKTDTSPSAVEADCDVEGHI
ncbi:NRDE family protein [Natronorubrum thiooxidans]|uniref:NRDE family protein n=1 Tax=Natronorubrum thiooxidans TaxID=308853 RepID=UPI0009715D9A|nr:NRDE family protein [Natronorubrum thiooxidans]